MPAARPSKPYHHGDLQPALLAAAWELVKEGGVDALTLRACARRAGVSHNAPIHHFGNVAGLIAELAAEGYERLTASMNEAMEDRPKEPLRAAGLGYIRFATKHPEHFRLMWNANAENGAHQRLREAARAAKGLLQEALQGAYLREHAHHLPENELAIRVAVAWSAVHGFAMLVSGREPASKGFPTPEIFLARLRPAVLGPF